MSIDQTRDHVKELRERFASDPAAHALALADQLNWLGLEFGLTGDYDSAAACTNEAFEVLTAHVVPSALSPGEEFRYACLAASVATGLLMEGRGALALPLLNTAIEANATLSHLAGATVVQPTFEPPTAGPTPKEAALAARIEAASRAAGSGPPDVSPFADDQPPVPFATPPGAFARPDRGWLQAADWTTVHWNVLSARARVLASMGERDRALDDAIEALAINLGGTELDYARLVSSLQPGLERAVLLVEGTEPEAGPLGW